MDKQDFLCEIGCEELPIRMVQTLAQTFADNISKELSRETLEYSEVQWFATPRRIAVVVQDLQAQQAPRETERQGPALEQAYDKEGTPTLACLGFVKSCGVSIDELEILDTPKGKRVFCRVKQPGTATTDVLPTLVNNALRQLPIPKPMRWGNYDTEFVRPVHWVAMLFGKDVVSAQILGQQTSRETYGHRFHYPRALRISQPKEYSVLLYSQGHVFADYAKRKAHIKKLVMHASQAMGQAVIDQDLLDDVTSLVEWPIALLGKFNPDFLKVPKEVLITSMRTHQKYFPIENAEGELQPCFVLVSNIESKNPAQVIKGNERVINARLSDAAFFYQNDLKHSLESRFERLHSVVFQQQLGSIAERSERIAALAKLIAKQLGADTKHAEHAGRLSKCDLVSDMVGEFPDLQGVMGYYYALNDGEPAEVAQAIKEHYLPRFAGDALPESVIGCAVSIASRLDTLVGILGINKIPTGEKDPFALRRAAHGVLRIILEKQLDLDLVELLKAAEKAYEVPLPNKETLGQCFVFTMERLRFWFSEQGVSTEVFESVSACHPTRPLDFQRRVQAVLQFQQLPESTALAAANKRVSNILKKIDGNDIPKSTNAKLFELDEERELAKLLQSLQKSTTALSQHAEYTEALTELATLKQPVDAFFEKVMVMVDDEEVRSNRLALLNSLRNLFTQVADISLLPS